MGEKEGTVVYPAGAFLSLLLPVAAGRKCT